MLLLDVNSELTGSNTFRNCDVDSGFGESLLPMVVISVTTVGSVWLLTLVLVLLLLFFWLFRRLCSGSLGINVRGGSWIRFSGTLFSFNQCGLFLSDFNALILSLLSSSFLAGPC